MRLLSPKLILAVAAAAILFIMFSLAQELNRRVQVQREVVRLEQGVRDLEKKTIAMESLNQYFRSDAFRERMAREKLNYRAPGEKVVLIPEGQVAGEFKEEEETTEEPTLIPLRWWKAFFVGDSAQTVWRW